MFGQKQENQRQSDLQLFTIYDSKTESYRDPVMAVNQHDLARQITNSFREQRDKNGYFANAEDYSVFYLGDYCRKTGTIAAREPVHQFNLHDLRSVVLNMESPAPEQAGH